MKKTLLSMLMIASCFGVANAQLLVNETGKVGVGVEETETLLPQLSVKATGEGDVAMSVNTQHLTGLQIQRTGYNTSTPHYGIYAYSQPYGVENYGVYGRSANSSYGTQTTNASFGVAGVASGGRNGRNFGVAGFLADTYGTGIFGSYTNAWDSFPVNGVYAGFFHGDVYITGTTNTPTLIAPSDYRLKRDIKTISTSCLSKVMDMNIVEFKYNQREIETVANIDGGAKKTIAWCDENSPVMKNIHYGLIAQELKEIYPDLVIENQDGYLGVNYLEIIPILIRSVQELNAKVEQYENGGAPVYKAQARTADAEATAIDAIVTTLYQNTPNPFTESTLVQCDIAEGVAQADIYIYDMNGKQITTYPITERGATNVTIEGHSLEAGMYLYALIADGQVIDTKRMILTK